MNTVILKDHIRKYLEYKVTIGEMPAFSEPDPLLVESVVNKYMDPLTNGTIEEVVDSLISSYLGDTKDA